ESLPSGTEVYENEKQQQRALTDPDLEAFLAAAEAERDAIEEDLVWVNELGAGKTTGPQPLARTRRETTRDTQRLGAVDTTSVLSSQVIPAAPVVKRRIWPRRAAAIAVMAGAVVAAVLVVRAHAPPPPARPRRGRRRRRGRPRPGRRGTRRRRSSWRWSRIRPGRACSSTGSRAAWRRARSSGRAGRPRASAWRRKATCRGRRSSSAPTPR